MSPKRFCKISIAVLGRGEVDGLGFLDQRAYPIDPAAVLERARDRVDHLRKPLQRQRAGVDLLPAGRLFAQLRYVHVAEIRQHQRARDRRRREHQKIDGFAFARQRQPLMHAEAVLLVDDGQRQIAERDIVLEQSVGADDQIDLAGGEADRISGRSRPRSRPVRMATRMPAAAASGAMVVKCWRARISVGAMNAA